MSTEFVAFDAAGKEIDWVDPYEGHKEIEPMLYLVTNDHFEYEVRVPEGGRYEIREMVHNDD